MGSSIHFDHLPSTHPTLYLLTPRNHYVMLIYSRVQLRSNLTNIAIEICLTDVDRTSAKKCVCAHCKIVHQFLLISQKRQMSCVNNFVITQLLLKKCPWKNKLLFGFSRRFCVVKLNSVTSVRWLETLESHTCYHDQYLQTNPISSIVCAFPL